MTTDRIFDLVVIGGGVNGAGVARDAAGRGANVLLLEAGDLARGTSSASTKLVHGGLRYLEYYEFALVRESLKERETLLAIAPHLVRPMRFVLPQAEGMRPRWMLRAGLFLYDHIGGRISLPGARGIKLSGHPAGAPIRADLKRGFEYSDCWVDDARLVVTNARDAKARGATILTREKVTAIAREGQGEGLWRVTSEKGEYYARAIVNASGPGVDDVARSAGRKPAYETRRVRGSHIVVPRLFDHDFAYIFQLPDTRICFAIPYEGAFTLIGTTDADHAGPLDNVQASADEIAYLCEAASAYFRKPVAVADVVYSYAGVRALIDDGSGRPEAATRGYRLPISAPEEGALIAGVYGGKITSYRHVAEEGGDELAERLPDMFSRGHWTGDAPLPGGDFGKGGRDLLIAEIAGKYAFLSAQDAERIGGAYGLDAMAWMGAAKSWDDLGRNFGCGFSAAELDWLIAEEWAQTAEDVLWRRTKLGLHMSAEQQAALQDYMGG